MDRISAPLVRRINVVLPHDPTGIYLTGKATEIPLHTLRKVALTIREMR